MAKYHIRENGEPGLCTASVRGCPRGGDSDHFDSPEEAREAYEAKQGDLAWGTMRKVPAHPAQPEGARRAQLLLKSLDETYEGLKAQAAAKLIEAREGRAELLQAMDAAVAATGKLVTSEPEREHAHNLEKFYIVAKDWQAHLHAKLKEGHASERELAESDFLTTDLEARRLKARLDQLPSDADFARTSREFQEVRLDASLAWSEAQAARRTAYAIWRERDPQLADKPWPPTY